MMIIDFACTMTLGRQGSICTICTPQAQLMSAIGVEPFIQLRCETNLGVRMHKSRRNPCSHLAFQSELCDAWRHCRLSIICNLPLINIYNRSSL